MDTTDLVLCDIALPPVGTAPEWVQLLPAGRRIEGRDGRSWEMQDPAGLVLAFQRNGADLPVDVEHQNDRPEAKLKGSVPAAGRIKELKADAGGIRPGGMDRDRDRARDDRASGISLSLAELPLQPEVRPDHPPERRRPRPQPEPAPGGARQRTARPG